MSKLLLVHKAIDEFLGTPNNPFNYIGFRGLSDDIEPSSGRYLDSMPGINIVRASEVASDDKETAEKVVKECIENGIHESVIDFVGLLSKFFQFKSVLDNRSINMCGSHTFYGTKTGLVSIKCSRQYDSDAFKKMHFRGLQLYSDRDINAVEFKVSTSTDPESTISVDIKEGLNNIPIEIKVNSEYVRVAWSLASFEIGKKEHYVLGSASCIPCIYPRDYQYGGGIRIDIEQSSDDGLTWSALSGVTTFGFNAHVSLVGDKMVLGSFFKDELSQAILYKSGIFFLQESLTTTRLTPYLRNSKKEREMLLKDWGGSVDEMTGKPIAGAYWRKLKTTVDGARYHVQDLSSDCIVCSGMHMRNTLPG